MYQEKPIHDKAPEFCKRLFNHRKESMTRRSGEAYPDFHSAIRTRLLQLAGVRFKYPDILIESSSQELAKVI